ncbi:MAG: glycoside hydrolase family 43 protein [Candidatus Pseudobacter hemicellulosilyticus]|uniref:Glycoside hydrolase family 43 protein n=1 Tax=Candidatus Pseudobacter hemicellulosilyticus TaxID=3121375 RepID=A0AAJ6BHL6_9BACT|nr:MAG: glycoside hydrolase family 43 protein [Pseudobacter sp.]
MYKWLCILLALTGPQVLPAQDRPVYLFSYFKDNGQDGLHLAYSEDALQWTALNKDAALLSPALGQNKLMRDPCIIRGGDGLFHLVFTISWKEPSIGYASSKDLVHWSPQKQIPVLQQDSGVRNCWAPEITYDPATKEYLIYWSSTITGRFPAGTESEDGFNHRIYCVTTKDFNAFSETRLLYEPGFNVIDASIVRDGKRWVMFLKDESLQPVPAKNLKLAFARKLAGPYSPATAPITGQYWAEGPATVKKDNQWLLYFDKYQEGSYGAMSSTDLRNWKDISDKISLPKGIRHGSIFTVTRAEFDHLLMHTLK